MKNQGKAQGAAALAASAQATRELANTDHDGLVPLTLHVVRSLQRIGRSQPLPRSCLHASDRPWP